jgi:eukaryotic-like serine/threonine-protein kinase
MGESISASDIFNELAFEFAERIRHGERPSLSEYADRHPELADEIRDLFPTLVMIEQLRSGEDQLAERSTHAFAQVKSIPERLGDYRILREIGRGGMGVVYEAEQESLGRHVALKVLTRHRHLGPIQLIRFQREARAAALLHHTNIVPVFAVGADDDVHYYAMQYIHGRNLDSVLREVIRLRREADPEKAPPHDVSLDISVSLARGLLTDRFWVQPGVPDLRAVDSFQTASSGGTSAPAVARIDAEAPLAGGSSSSSSSSFGRNDTQYYRSVARLGVQAAEALAHAHGHGVVHRDIKPANLLLDLQGTIWVTDFGLARADGAEDLTTPGDVVGTLRYMAPERFQGKSDQRCDIYSLGISLYEMLTLKPAFTASHRVELMSSIVETEPTRPRQLDPLIPRDLETIVLKAIAKNPADRFSNAGEMARELSRFVEGRPIRSRRVTVPERLWRWSRRNPAVAILTLLAMFLTTVLAITSTTAALKFRDQRDAVRNEQRNTRAELGRSLLSQGRAMRLSREPGRRAQGLETLAKAARIASAGAAPTDLTEQLRDEVIATLAEIDERPVRTWPGLNLTAETAAFSFDDDRYVFVGKDGSIHLHRLTDKAEIQVLKSGQPAVLSWPVLIPGGRFLLVLSGSTQVHLWDLERRELFAAWPADVRGATYRPDGRQVAALRSNGELRVYDLAAMTETARCDLELDIPRRISNGQLALSGDGRYLALMRPETQDAWVYEVANGDVVLELEVPVARVHTTIALSRDAGLLAVTHDRAISVYDVANGERLAILQGHQSEGINAAFNPGGGLLASQCWDGMTRLWDPIRGRLVVALPGGFRGWAGSGSDLVVSRDRDLVLYQIARGEERRTIDCRMLSEQAGAALYGPARVEFSPDGQMIAMALRPEGVRIVRASDGAGLAHLPIGYCDEVLYLRDGSLLTCNNRGLCRWPVRRLPGDILRMGPPEPLEAIIPRAGFVHVGLASSADGRLIGISSQGRQGSLLLDLDHPWRRTWLVPQRWVSDLAISPDGRWVATNGTDLSRNNQVVKVWDGATGELQVELPAEQSHVAFSPDGQWLAMNGSSHYRFFKAGTWSPGPEINCGVQQGPMRMAFHPSSRIAALVDTSQAAVRVVEVETGRTIALFESPDESNLYCLVFSPDGRFLATAHTDQRVDLWDLSTIRGRLEEFNLAAGLPDIFRGRALAGDDHRIDRIEVAGADPAGLRLLAARFTLRQAGLAVRGLVDSALADPQELSVRAGLWDRLGQWRLAVNDYRKSLARRPEVAIAANNLAWCLVSAPGRGDVDEAVGWARKAVEMVPGSINYRNTLGAALYRAGRFAEAAGELERNLAGNNDASGYDCVFLAMCRERLGQTEPARNALDRARKWRDSANRASPAVAAEFHSLLREATAVVDRPLPELPSNVFDR